MEEIIKDLVKLATDVSRLSEQKLIYLADKLAKQKRITREEAKKIVIAGVKHAARAQRTLTVELGKKVEDIVKRAKACKHVAKKATKKRRK